MSIASGLVSQLALVQGNAIASLGMTWKFTGVIRAGDTIHVKVTTTEARPSKSSSERGILVRDIEIVNQHGEVVQKGDWSIMLLTRPKEAGSV